MGGGSSHVGISWPCAAGLTIVTSQSSAARDTEETHVLFTPCAVEWPREAGRRGVSELHNAGEARIAVTRCVALTEASLLYVLWPLCVRRPAATICVGCVAPPSL